MPIGVHGWLLACGLAFAALLGWATLGWRARQRQRSALQLVDFLATLGHEVRTPMTGVLGMSELLLGSALDPLQRRHAEAIRHASQHLLHLVDDALDLARIEAGRLQLDPQPFELRALLSEVVGLQAPLARRRGLRFVQEIAADAPAASLGDALRIRQVLFNLLGNAIKFTEQGEVGLRAGPLAGTAGGLRIVVHDTGPGLDAGQQGRLFRRFEQGDGARTAARYGGSGLGLAISQELAAAMGGRILVESAPGEGARFIVELPLPGVVAGDEACVGAGG